jgi:hypothetical protein
MTFNEFITAIALGGSIGFAIHYGTIAWQNWKDRQAYLASCRRAMAKVQKRVQELQVEASHMALVEDVWIITQANQRFRKQGDDPSPEAMMYKNKPLRDYSVPDLKEIVLGHYHAQIDQYKKILA